MKDIFQEVLEAIDKTESTDFESYGAGHGEWCKKIAKAALAKDTEGVNDCMDEWRKLKSLKGEPMKGLVLLTKRSQEHAEMYGGRRIDVAPEEPVARLSHPDTKIAFEELEIGERFYLELELDSPDPIPSSA